MAVRAAEQLVSLAYLLADLLGSTDEARAWLRGLPDGARAHDYMPAELTADNRGLLADRLASAGVVHDGRVDHFRVDEADQILAVVPLIALMEDQRRPKSRPSLVCTLPTVVELQDRRRRFGRSLGVLVADALRSVGDDGRILIASPFWSQDGCQLIKPALQRARALQRPVTLAGASRAPVEHGQADYRRAMCDFATELVGEGHEVRCLTYESPSHGSLFHAKVVCGTTGYLGSGNITAAGLERHVEIGVPLTPVDVAEVWWLLDQLVDVGLLVTETP